MLHNFWNWEHLIYLHVCVWCGKCAKYLAFGTFTTLAIDALANKRNVYIEKQQANQSNLGFTFRALNFLCNEKSYKALSRLWNFLDLQKENFIKNFNILQ